MRCGQKKMYNTVHEYAQQQEAYTTEEIWLERKKIVLEVTDPQGNKKDLKYFAELGELPVFVIGGVRVSVSLSHNSLSAVRIRRYSHT